MWSPLPSVIERLQPICIKSTVLARYHHSCTRLAPAKMNAGSLSKLSINCSGVRTAIIKAKQVHCSLPKLETCHNIQTQRGHESPEFTPCTAQSDFPVYAFSTVRTGYKLQYLSLETQHWNLSPLMIRNSSAHGRRPVPAHTALRGCPAGRERGPGSAVCATVGAGTPAGFLGASLGLPRKFPSTFTPPRPRAAMPPRCCPPVDVTSVHTKLALTIQTPLI